MADSACLVHAFSYAYGDESLQCSSMKALGESVSFGRFMSESLAWEKWSSFSNKRYVEEAQRYAQPGSVAEKKAFFEAHYKKIAAMKAASLLEQANHGGDGDLSTTHVDTQVGVSGNGDLKAVDKEGDDLNTQLDKFESFKEEEDCLRTDHDVLQGSKPENKLDYVDNYEVVSDSEQPCASSQSDKPLLEKNSSTDQEATSLMSKKKKPAAPPLTPLVQRRASKIPPAPAPAPAKPEPTPPVYAKKEHILTPGPAKTTPPYANKEQIVPPNATRSTTYEEKSNPRSLWALLSSSTLDPEEFAAPSIQKIESSKAVPSISKPTKDCSTPLKTPIVAPKHNSSTTTCSEDKGDKTPLVPSALGSKKGPKWHILSAACSKSLSSCRKKLQSPTIATPCCFRTEERSTRRKQNLEEKFNAKAVPKVQLPTKLKEKAETELGKLRRSLCFRAQPEPQMHGEKEASKNQAPVTNLRSPKLGKNPYSVTVQGKKDKETRHRVVRKNS